MLNSELYSYVSKFYILVPEQYIFISKGFVHIYGNPKQASTISLWVKTPLFIYCYLCSYPKGIVQRDFRVVEISLKHCVLINIITEKKI